MIPENSPAGLTTVLYGQLQHAESIQRSTFLRATDSELGSFTAQKVGNTNWYALIATVPKHTNSLKFDVKPAKGETTVSVRATETGFDVLDQQRHVLSYQVRPKSLDGKSTRANYVHPLYGLDGEVLTQDFPSDHIHHRGVFWAWHQLLVNGAKTGDSWDTSDYLSVVKSVDVTDHGTVFSRVKITVDWTSSKLLDDSGEPKPFVRETTWLTVYAAAAETQLIDFVIQLKPLVDDVRIGGAENVKEYSGFTVRVKPPKGIKIVDESADLKEDGRGRTSRWMDVSGDYGTNETSGIGILSHPKSTGFPYRWLLRHYGMQNVIYPGRVASPLPKETPVTLRHRLVIHRKSHATARVADQQRAFEILTPPIP